MSWWNKKFERFKSVIEKEKDRHVTNPITVCLHGETNCVRCMTDDFSEVLGITWEFMEDIDIKQVIYSLPEAIVILMRKYAGISVLAGGYIRATVANEEVNDIDIFVPTNEIGERFASELYNKTYYMDANHIQVYVDGIEVQIIWRYPYKKVNEILEQFDYTVAKAAIWFDEGIDKEVPDFKGICHQRFYKDLARKLLVYDCNREVERVQSIPRLLKYTKYGYSIEPSSLSAVIAKTCLSLDLTNGFDGMQKQLEECYTITKSSGQDKKKDWKAMTEKYVKPVPVPARSYSYGS